MTPEKIDTAPREIKFGGAEKAADIKRGFAITTLRNPKPAYDFKQGEVILADCFDSGEKVPVVVLSNETKMLKDFSAPQLALDGFFFAVNAAKEMKSWPGYEKTTINTEMQAITFVEKKSFDRLSKETKGDMDRYFDSLIQWTPVRRLFFPTMCFHLASTYGTLYNWAYFIRDNRLISENEFQQMLDLASSNEGFKDPRILMSLSGLPRNRLFKRAILGIFPK